MFKGGGESLCVSAALDEEGVAYLATTWATTNTACLRNLTYPQFSICPTWGTYIMAVQ
jgi:hypothetical protein